MGALQTVLRAFIASPSDVSDERALLDEVVTELNATWSQALGVRIEVIKWETHTFPDAGSAVQTTINRQIGDEYDLFIGIMWTRFGTPTHQYGSGTEEEFRRALERYKTDPSSLHVMFYFKNAPVAPDDIETEQLARVHGFRQSLGEEGTYHWTFRTLQEFSSFLRVHLARVVQAEIQSIAAHQETTSPTTISPAGDSTSTEELGILDHLEIIEERFHRAGTCLQRITAAMTECAQSMDGRAAEINAVTARGNVQLSDIKRMTARTAEDLDLFVSRTHVEIPVFAQSFAQALDHITKGMSLWSHDVGLAGQQSQDLQTTLEITQTSIDQYAATIIELQATVTKLPRINVVLNRAKRRTLKSLEQLRDAAHFVAQSNRDALKLLSGQ